MQVLQRAIWLASGRTPAGNRDRLVTERIFRSVYLKFPSPSGGGFFFFCGLVAHSRKFWVSPISSIAYRVACCVVNNAVVAVPRRVLYQPGWALGGDGAGRVGGARRLHRGPPSWAGDR